MLAWLAHVGYTLHANVVTIVFDSCRFSLQHWWFRHVLRLSYLRKVGQVTFAMLIACGAIVQVDSQDIT